jgi:hypothetical protein
VYIYNWRYDGNERWDSGLISREGVERRAYFELVNALSEDRFRPLSPVVGEPLPEPLPEPAPPPPPAPSG